MATDRYPAASLKGCLPLGSPPRLSYSRVPANQQGLFVCFDGAKGLPLNDS